MSLTWDEFVATHARLVLTTALRILKAPADADDVAQEVFLEIFRSGKNKFIELHRQPALLRAITARRAIDGLRRRKPWSELHGGEINHREFEPREYAIADELDQRLQEALVKLPPREAEVFCLTHLEGCSQAEIAHTLGISTGAVAKALCLARAKLTAAFGMSTSEAKS